MSHLPKLREMVTHNRSFRLGPIQDHALEDGAFLALTVMKLVVRLEDIEDTMQNPDFPCTVKRLCIRSLPVEEDTAAKTALCDIKEAADTRRIGLQTFHKFAIRNYRHLDPVDENCEMLARSMSNLRCIVLGPNPLVRTAPSLALMALVPFAKYCQFMNRMFLYLDGNSIPQNQRLPVFNEIKILGFGLSPLKEVNTTHVILFLSKLIRTPSCTSSSFDSSVIIGAKAMTSSFYEQWASPEDKNDVISSRKSWQTVNK
ncbi:hypothetical protein M422DRAFT_259915 [Sphaerobolus stellatus SS14]|uniref:Uncharacterized protein n=1 Tax=Sphaerobolus stellatus (strain SS14) TaxID=990650 RepID=A0A0C9VJJ9_SPHS4|nr:hypothetical protein M422DRAFT_273474 [Sphaerobolus stellatus SS14]KIJ37561.1 hypothetical protein M422DRAFT_259915 [Sphaerobolus stellatus SS14]